LGGKEKVLGWEKKCRTSPSARSEVWGGGDSERGLNGRTTDLNKIELAWSEKSLQGPRRILPVREGSPGAGEKRDKKKESGIFGMIRGGCAVRAKENLGTDSEGVLFQPLEDEM